MVEHLARTRGVGVRATETLVTGPLLNAWQQVCMSWFSVDVTFYRSSLRMAMSAEYMYICKRLQKIADADMRE